MLDLFIQGPQCSPVVAELTPVCVTTSVVFMLSNIAFVLFCVVSAEQPL